MARWWIYAKGLLGLVACCQAAEEAAWTVMCNADCGGVNTCAEKQLCSGRMEETSTCPDALPCPDKGGTGTDCWPKDCQWAEWNEWQNDGVSGLCTRTRRFSASECGGQQCLGTTKDTMYCDPLVHPPSDCVFSQWSDFGSCDPVTLQRNRTRTVEKQPAYGGAACNGPLQLTEPCGDRDAPVACVLGDWMEWSGCTRPCGGGQQTQVRAIMQEAAAGGKLCQGENGSPLVLQKTRPCNVDIFCGGEEAPQDCMLSDWNEWTACDAAKSRQRHRSRSIAIPGKNGGAACSQSLQEVKGCEASEELPPVDCRLGAWGAWSLCDKTCAGGQTYRSREVAVLAARGGKACEDSMSETMACNEMDCHMDKQARDCHLSVWTSWGDCSQSCGKGIRTRTREVTAPPLMGGIGCSADIQQVEGCPDLPPCEAEDCLWGTWSEWSDCTKQCNGGQKMRNRTVFQLPSKSGKPCHALRSVDETESCNTQSCSAKSCQDGVWADWHGWSQCSRPCAGGLKWRHRSIYSTGDSCGKPAEGPSSEASRCNEWPCEEDSDCVMGLWSSWSDCSASCYGLQLRKREIAKKGTGHGRWCMDPDNQPAALEESRPCNGPEGASADQQQDCGFGEMQDCLLSSWGRWSTCSKSCGGGFQHRSRRTLRDSKLGGKPCDGEMRQVQSCGTASCGLAMDCQWEDWDQWGACTRCDGEMIRVREIRHLGNDLGKRCEPSDSRQVAQCNECPKKQTFWCVWGAWKEGACSATCGTGGRLERRRELKTLSSPPHNPLDAVGNVSGVGASCEAYEVDYTSCKNLPLTCASCIPEDCKFGAWEDWKKPTTCDGICTRQRGIERLANSCGAVCNGHVRETKTCVLEECSGKQDCAFSHWSEWNGCSAGGSQQTRVREIVALNGPYGKACSGAQKETKPCEASKKARDCTLTPWSGWSECSKRCGGGQKERTREVADHALHGGKPCEVPLRSTMPCEEKLCLGNEPGEEDCILGDWEEWNGCSKGLQAFRVRRPVREAGANGLPCSGALKETGACPELKARDCAFSDWGTWGSCGATCGGGQRFRTREVKHAADPGGQPCMGDTHESETCNEEVACDVQNDCVVSSWSLWSECSKSCGQGLYARERKILQAASSSGRGCNVVLWEVDGCQGEGTSEICGDHVDCQWGEWKGWSDCKQAQYCGLGHRSRAREIAVHPTGKGAKCDPLPKEEVVPDISCAVSCTPSSVCTNGEWGQWSVWGPCSITCGQGGTRSRSRVEKVKANHCGYPPEGSDQDYEPCDAVAECESEMGAQDCQFGLWSSWEESSASCNGAQKRTREIARYSAYGGFPCHGTIAETQRCNPGPAEQGPPIGCISGAPVDCVQWPATDWSPCTASCGTGHQTRRYEVAVQPAFGGKSCAHPLEETRECQALQECVIEERDCVLTDWQEWTHCDPFTAQRFRRRQVKYAQVGAGKACEGKLSETEKCSRECQDKTYSCAWASWESWSACSESCGTRGRRHRSRGLSLTEKSPAATPATPAAGVTTGETTAEGVTGVTGLAPINTAAVLEEYQHLSRRLNRASGSHVEFFISFLAGAGCFAAVVGLIQMTLRRVQHGPQPRALLLPFAPNSGDHDWRQVEVAQGDDLGAEFGSHKDTSLVRQSASLRSRPTPSTRGGNSFTFTPPQDVRLPTEVSPKSRVPPLAVAAADTVPDVKSNKSMPKSQPLQMPSNQAPKPAATSSKRRICLQYQQDDNPRGDLLTLAGGQGSPVVVQMIAGGGRAEQAGVKPGAVIVAINGSTAFQNFPAWQVRAIIQPPANVEVEQEMQLSPASPRCKEIRLTRKSELQLGIAPKGGAWHPKDNVMLAEEVIFKPRTAPLWLSSFDRAEGQDRPASPIYELRRPEAHRLVNNAVRNAWDTVSKQEKHVSRVPRGSRARSSSPYCGLETCLPQWSSGGNVWRWDPGPPVMASHGVQGRLSPRRPPQAQSGPSPWNANEAGAPPQLPLSGRGSWNSDLDASPLRWVSPVFAPFLGYSSACSPNSRRGPRSPSNSPRNRSSSPKPIKARGDVEDVVDFELPPSIHPSFSRDDDETSGVLLQHQL